MKLVLRLFAVLVLVSAGSTVYGDYGNPTLPDLSAYKGYTSQFWGLHAVDGSEPAQALAPDNYSNNPYGTASATWVTGSSVGWNDTVPGTQPSWVEGIYGGNVIFDSSDNGPFTIDVSVPTGSETGKLLVYVQYDWYDRVGSSYPDDPSIITPSVAGATLVSSTDEVLASYSTLITKQWVRTTAVYELESNSGNIDVSFLFEGYSPIIDSFSITTVVVPEPATMTVLGLGALSLFFRKHR